MGLLLYIFDEEWETFQQVKQGDESTTEGDIDDSNWAKDIGMYTGVENVTIDDQ